MFLTKFLVSANLTFGVNYSLEEKASDLERSNYCYFDKSVSSVPVRGQSCPYSNGATWAFLLFL